jgi:hypothetical protein
VLLNSGSSGIPKIVSQPIIASFMGSLKTMGEVEVRLLLALLLMMGEIALMVG